MELTLEEALKSGIEAHTAGQVQDAERLYTAILKAQPKHPDANHNMGVLAVGVGKIQEALPFFKVALMANPSIDQFWLSYINALIKLDRIADAQALLNQAKDAGSNGEVFDQLEQMLYELSANPKDPPLEQLQLINNCYIQGQLQQALSHAAEVLERFPDSAIVYNIAGASQAGLMQYDAAVDCYKQAVLIKPDYAEAWSNMGNALKDKGDLGAAIESYRQAIKIKPDYAEAYYNMGIALEREGKVEAVIDSYQRAVLINPDYADAYYNLGVTLKDSGDLEAAIESYKWALKIKPDYAEAYSNMGNALQDKGDSKAAVESYKGALKIKPDYAEAYYNMGVALNGKGDSEAAIESYKEALKIKPDYPEAYNNMGNALKDTGDPEAAIESYQEALKIKPYFAEAYYNMGNALQHKGDSEAAIGSYQEALKIKPDYHEAWNSLEFPLQTMKLQGSAVESFISKFNPQSDLRYVQISKAILNYRLDLGGEHAERSLNKVLRLLSTVDDRVILNPEVLDNELLTKVSGPEKIVSLVHFGRSGTGLLHSLIDGHPEVSTMPSIYFSEFFNPSTWEKIVAGGWNEMVDRVMAIYEVLFDASARNPIETKSTQFRYYMGQKEGLANVGDQQDEVLKVNRVLFRAELRRLMSFHNYLDAFAFFQLLHIAYDKSLNDHNHKHLIFYHIHNPDVYAKLNFVKATPSTNWVMMVREPLQACESWVRSSLYNNKHIGISSKIVTMLFELDNIIYRKQRSIGVRLEDLKKFPRKTIPALCEWMGIGDNESLYKMTAQGKKWWGDPASPDYEKDGMEPFGKTSIRRKVGSVFTENDQFILRTLFHPFSVRFGYVEENLEQFKGDLKTIRPMLEEMFGFEKVMAERSKVSEEQFMKSGSYLYLRSGLIERWKVLAKFGTYPNMVKPLKVN